MFERKFQVVFAPKTFSLNQLERIVPPATPAPAPTKMITAVELGAMAGGVALTVAGSLLHSQLLALPGELLLGASIFSLIVRHSAS